MLKFLLSSAVVGITLYSSCNAETIRKKVLYGRKGVIEELVSCINDGNKPVYIKGYTNSGKTSIVRQSITDGRKYIILDFRYYAYGEGQLSTREFIDIIIQELYRGNVGSDTQHRIVNDAIHNFLRSAAISAQMEHKDKNNDMDINEKLRALCSIMPDSKPLIDKIPSDNVKLVANVISNIPVSIVLECFNVLYKDMLKTRNVTYVSNRMLEHLLDSIYKSLSDNDDKLIPVIVLDEFHIIDRLDSDARRILSNWIFYTKGKTSVSMILAGSLTPKCKITAEPGKVASGIHDIYVRDFNVDEIRGIYEEMKQNNAALANNNLQYSDFEAIYNKTGGRASNVISYLSYGEKDIVKYCNENDEYKKYYRRGYTGYSYYPYDIAMDYIKKNIKKNGTVSENEMLSKTKLYASDIDYLLKNRVLSRSINDSDSLVVTRPYLACFLEIINRDSNQF